MLLFQFLLNSTVLYLVNKDEKVEEKLFLDIFKAEHKQFVGKLL